MGSPYGGKVHHFAFEDGGLKNQAGEIIFRKAFLRAFFEGNFFCIGLSHSWMEDSKSKLEKLYLVSRELDQVTLYEIKFFGNYILN